jgi:hypothetical protein
MKEAPPRAAMLALPIHEHTEFILVTPHYPENVGASPAPSRRWASRASPW